MSTQRPKPRFFSLNLLVVGVLLLQFALALGSVTHNGPTMDEQGFIMRGLAYLRNEQRQIRVGHPLGLNALNSFLLVNDDTVHLPTQDPSWQGTSFHRPGELFLWEIGNDVPRVMFLARLPSVWLGLLLAAVVGRWAREMSRRRWAGVLALSLVALDPNFLAHSSLATTDLGLAAAAAFSGYTLWRFLRQPGWGRAIIAGAAFGLLQNTKFTAGLFVPLFGLVILVWLIYLGRTPSHAPRITSPKSWRNLFAAPLTQLLIAYPLAGFLTLWACYGFNIGTLPDNLPTLSQLSGLTLPLAHHLEQLLDIGGRLQMSTPSFLLGRYSDQGWWSYFPVAFLLKTPLPTLILLVWAVGKWVKGLQPGKRLCCG
ncbi:MAG: phospholipid carrier-dependent glycosyltransferase [Chloroflexi bacterium]|nr:phospholipid carrier-dependent glycosyltransferase [Chloroflexota bacterium]